jgi:hypothetical protein
VGADSEVDSLLDDFGGFTPGRVDDSLMSSL